MTKASLFLEVRPVVNSVFRGANEPGTSEFAAWTIRVEHCSNVSTKRRIENLSLRMLFLDTDSYLADPSAAFSLETLIELDFESQSSRSAWQGDSMKT